MNLENINIDELKFEVYRNITERQMICFQQCIRNLDRKKQDWIDATICEFIDCIFDGKRCYKKKYVSYSEYLLFNTLLEILIEKII